MDKYNTHIVIKREDVYKYCTEVEAQALETILRNISKGRALDGKKAFNEYYLCNVDEPYADIVKCFILDGEAAKGNNARNNDVLRLCPHPDEVCANMTLYKGKAYCDSVPCSLKDDFSNFKK